MKLFGDILPFVGFVTEVKPCKWRATGKPVNVPLHGFRVEWFFIVITWYRIPKQVIRA